MPPFPLPNPSHSVVPAVILMVRSHIQIQNAWQYVASQSVVLRVCSVRHVIQPPLTITSFFPTYPLQRRNALIYTMVLVFYIKFHSM